MRHWYTSSVLGFILTGRYAPLCARVYNAPDCAAKRAYMKAMDALFHEHDHCRRIALTYAIGRSIR